MADCTWFKEGTYYARNRKRLLAASKARYATNKAKCNAYTNVYGHGYYATNKPRILAARPWHYMFASAKTRAKKLGVVFDLDDQWASERWTGRCEVTGIEFAVDPKVGDKQGPRLYSPTIDRIDPTGGYTKDNCRFVLFGVNYMKLNGSDDDLKKIATAIAESKL